jgi:uncharacterized protein (DUF1800 family)
MHPRPNQKRKQGLNENYGRELMELHTLGVDGGYTQQDVTEVARCFTGWTIRQPQQGGGFEFNARCTTKARSTFSASPSPRAAAWATASRCSTFWRTIPPRRTSSRRASPFASFPTIRPKRWSTRWPQPSPKTDGDLREVMRTMLKRPEFWDPANFRSKVKSPLEMVASAVRAVNGDVDFAGA